MSDGGRKWQGRTDGTPWMHRSLVGMMKIVPLWLMYFFVLLAVPVYRVVNRKAFAAICHYFRRRHGYGRLKSLLYAWLNHVTFGFVVIDKFAAFAGKKFRVDVPEMPVYEDLCQRPEGILQVSSHVGGDEMAGYVLKAGKKINALAFGGEAETVTKNRAKMLDINNIRLIPIAEDLSHLYALNQALADGEIVNIHGDRVFGSPRVVRCDILGAGAGLPLGPFMLAAMREVPALAVFVMRTGYKRYKALLYRLDQDLGGLAGKERAEAMAKAYAGAMEKVLKLYPEQWFNFYEFWDDGA